MSEAKPRTRRPRPLPLGITILHEDRDLLVVNKPGGLLSMGTDRERERTAYFLMMDYVRKGNPKSRNRVFIVHRLDRETSGVLVFAKSEEAKLKLQESWDQSDKRYLAIVHGQVKPEEGSLRSYLAENIAHVVYSTDPTKGKFAQSDYRVLAKSDATNLVEVRLITGRKNQIRVQFAEHGNPLVGDRKYGQKKDPARVLALHAFAIEFPHPYSGRPVRCIAPPPHAFTHLVSDEGRRIIQRLQQLEEQQFARAKEPTGRPPNMPDQA